MNYIKNAVIVSLAVIAAGNSARLTADDTVDFDRDIRPLLSDRCYHCHGPDANTREADLRLDTKEDAFADRDGVPAIVSGKPEASEAIRRILSADPDERMPPVDSKMSLTEAEQELLVRWVQQGAAWSEHWAFRPLARPELPTVQNSEWPRQPLDYFVLSRLEQAGLRPSSPASPEKLLRRVTLDLTGIPPTLEELDAFLADPSDAAYEQVVQRLLNSPRYGERMAWPWLDAARYADTDGFQGDPTRTLWPWRDWLVQSLNDNMPFDQFTVEMLAGDLLESPTLDQIVASGFNRNHMYNGEGGRIAEETRVENVFDRTETTATIWLGLTMTCARCHDHKFDPVSQREYYRLYDFFNNTSEIGRGTGGNAPPVIEWRTPENREQVAQLQRQISHVESQLDAPQEGVDSAQVQWENDVARRLQTEQLDGTVAYGPWRKLGTLPPPGGDVSRVFDHEYAPEQRVDLEKTFAVGDRQEEWRTADDLEDGKIYKFSNDLGVTYLRRVLNSPNARVVDVSLGSDDGVKVWVNDELAFAKDITRGVLPDQDQIQLRLRSGDNRLLIKVVNTGGESGVYFRPVRESLEGFPESVERALATAATMRSDEQHRTLRRYYREVHSHVWKQQLKHLRELEAARDAIPSVRVMVMDDLPDDQKRVTKILERGVYDKPREETVTCGTPAFLPALPNAAETNRLTLARWLVDPQNPLPARVTVNRCWQIFFDRGLVKTSEDFGRQGSPPTHPQLLDWLATEMIASGWDVKALHRRIVTSATYRQSSKFTGEQGNALAESASELDPSNLLLWRAPRHRLPSWMLRDQALALSGLLVEQRGGPPVRPYQPPGIWAEATFGKIRYEPDTGASLYRRSLYVFWRRIVGPTMFFDAAKRQTCEVQPNRTNTPLHALTTLNEPLFVEASRAFAARLYRDLPDQPPDDRLAYAFRLATSRVPSADERAVLVNRWNALRSTYQSSPEQATQLLAVGESRFDGTIDVAEYAATTMVCSMIMNLDEVLSIE
ncbi:MAG: PSD1 domain-containing protein [Planctomycetales bacterium]|nr:PSD1 domain-containing protein [Planctomycetales bacterium]